jgi:hypothetical protein
LGHLADKGEAAAAAAAAAAPPPSAVAAVAAIEANYVATVGAIYKLNPVDR